jgi:lipopolysaccharide/colanic/teichoic acid biosynthesis glycosyltransferase
MALGGFTGNRNAVASLPGKRSYRPGAMLRAFQRSKSGRGSSTPAAAINGYEASKRLLDVSLSLTLLLATLPLWAVVALLIKITTPGPVFYRHRRLGRNGTEFWCWKFRSMYADADQRLARDPRLREAFQSTYKLKDDPRITPLGLFLRRTSLDELPQFLNVLLGEMSLIGPRPIVKPELDKYGESGEKLLTVQPGLGGMWQAFGRSDTTYDERVQLDMAYIDQRSLALDARLILLTATAVFRQRGSC